MVDCGAESADRVYLFRTGNLTRSVEIDAQRWSGRHVTLLTNPAIELAKCFADLGVGSLHGK